MSEFLNDGESQKVANAKRTDCSSILSLVLGQSSNFWPHEYSWTTRQ
jgi:hypothetical protein